MTRSQYVVVGIAADVVLLAASLASTGPLVASVALSLALGCVLVAAVGAMTCRGRRAAFWRGFAPIAAAYLAFAMVNERLSGTHRGISQVEFETASPRWLPTSWLLAKAYDRFGGEKIRTYGGTDAPAVYLLQAAPENIPAYLNLDPLQQFLTTGHCVLAVALGVAGGLCGKWLFDRSQTHC